MQITIILDASLTDNVYSWFSANAFKAGVSNSFSLRAISAFSLPSKGQLYCMVALKRPVVTWKTINKLHSTHQKQSSDINSLKLNDGTQTSCPISISNTLDEYFSSIGVSMGNGSRPTNTSFTTFMKSISQSFVLDGTYAEEIIACITNLKNTSSSGIDGI